MFHSAFWPVTQGSEGYSVRYRVVHHTEYRYVQPVALCHNETHLRPRAVAHQRCLSHALVIDPEPDLISEREDFFGNPTASFSLQRSHSHLSVTATSEVEVGLPKRPGQVADVPWEEAAEVLCHDLDLERLEARQFILDSPLCEAAADITQYAAVSLRPGGLLLESVAELSARIHGDFAYVPGFTSVTTPLSVVLEHRRGVCQDFAHLAIACLRAHGLAARYVSGYLETAPPPCQDKLIGADASHAWFAVYHPGLGWFDFDPTNNHCPDNRHITVAWGRDYGDVTPLKGVVYGGGQQQATVSVEVINLRGG